MNWLKRHWRMLAVALAVIALSAGISILPVGEWIGAWSISIQKLGLWGIVVFAGIYAAATVLFLPGSLLTITAGLIFGVPLGTVAAWSGAVLGSSLAFLIGRYFTRARIEAKISENEKLRAIDDAIGREGWKIIGLLRLSPLIPFNASNYFYGATKVRFWPYVLASGAGMLPGTLLYVYLGATGKAAFGGAKEHRPIEYIFFGVGLLATIGVTIWIGRMARNALQKTGVARAGAKQGGEEHTGRGGEDHLL